MPTPVYLDNAASTPPFPEITGAYAELVATAFVNPSSAHRLGYALQRQIDAAATDVLNSLAIPESEARVICEEAQASWRTSRRRVRQRRRCWIQSLGPGRRYQ